MAHNIEYHYGTQSNHLHPDFFSPRNWQASSTPPEDINRIWDIKVDALSTEDVNGMDKSEAKRKWKLLAPGRKVPAGYTSQTAVAFAQAIWLDTIWHNVEGHPRVVNSFFIGALSTYGMDMVYYHYNGRKLDWTVFKEIGEEAGVDLRVDSWLDGVPLEYILAE